MSDPVKLTDAERAAENMDWQQVVLNGGPPCFHLEKDGRFCGRAERWVGHDSAHKFISLAKLLTARLAEAQAAQGALLEMACGAICDRCRLDGPPRDAINEEGEGPRFVHTDNDGQEVECPAAAIRKLSPSASEALAAHTLPLVEALEASLLAYRIACRLDDNWQLDADGPTPASDPLIIQARTIIARYATKGENDGK